MINVSNKILNALSKYLGRDWNSEQLRDQMVDLRLQGELSDVDRAFLNEFEGRYAEFSDGLVAEQSFKNSLAKFVAGERPTSSAAAPTEFWFFSGSLHSIVVNPAQQPVLPSSPQPIISGQQDTGAVQNALCATASAA
jgi:hypothetical protein